MICTRYGYLSLTLVVAVELCAAEVVGESVGALDGAYRTLAVRLRGSPHCDGAIRGLPPAPADRGSPATVAERWEAVRIELFGVSEVETTPVPDPAVVVAELVEVEESRRIVKALFAAVGLFLVSEANSLDEFIPEDDDESFEDLRDTVMQVFACARKLRRHVNDGTWPQLHTADLDTLLTASPDSTEVAEPSHGNRSDSDVGALPESRECRAVPGQGETLSVDADSRCVYHRDQALRAFHRLSYEVPAYRDFLSRHGMMIDRVRTLSDFTLVPPTTHEDLVSWGPAATTVWSAGPQCAFGPSQRLLTEFGPVECLSSDDRILRGLRTRHRRTLVVTGCAHDNRGGRSGMLQVLHWLQSAGHLLSVATSETDPVAVARELAERGRNFEQVVLAGPPTFVEDVLEHVGRSALELDLSILLAGQSITESWRDRIVSMVESSGGQANPILLYGTTDTGIVGYETPSTIAIRRLARDNLPLAEALFGGHSTQLPTLVEYDRQRVYAELDTDRLLVTTDSPIPLVRYRIGDHARILDQEQLVSTLHEHGYRIPVRTMTPDAGFLVIDSHQDRVDTGIDRVPETARIRLVGHDADAELSDLMSWLYDEAALHGRLKIEKRSERISAASHALTIVLTTGLAGVAGTTAGALATALSMWLDRRRPHVTVEITRTDGRSATIPAGDLPAAEEARKLLEPAT